MGDSRLLNKVDAYIQEHLLEISEEEEFLKLPRLKVGVNPQMHNTYFKAQNLCPCFEQVMVMKKTVW